MKEITEYLKNSSTDHLLQISAHCKKITDPDLKLNESILTELRAQAKLKFSQKLPIATSLIWAIDLSSIPIDIAWYTLDFTDLKDKAQEFAAAAAILTFTIAICTALYIYQATVKENENNQCLIILKDQICDELKTRYPDNKKTNESKNIPAFTLSENKPKDSIYAGTSCAVILFTTFYWGILDIINSLGYEKTANFMHDTPYMSVIITLIVLTSFYLGYQHFIESNILENSQENISHLDGSAKVT
jgi:hypothetical protein